MSGFTHPVGVDTQTILGGKVHGLAWPPSIGALAGKLGKLYSCDLYAAAGPNATFAWGLGVRVGSPRKMHVLGFRFSPAADTGMRLYGVAGISTALSGGTDVSAYNHTGFSTDAATWAHCQTLPTAPATAAGVIFGSAHAEALADGGEIFYFPDGGLCRLSGGQCVMGLAVSNISGGAQFGTIYFCEEIDGA